MGVGSGTSDETKHIRSHPSYQIKWCKAYTLSLCFMPRFLTICALSTTFILYFLGNNDQKNSVWVQNTCHIFFSKLCLVEPANEPKVAEDQAYRWPVWFSRTLEGPESWLSRKKKLHLLLLQTWVPSTHTRGSQHKQVQLHETHHPILTSSAMLSLSASLSRPLSLPPFPLLCLHLSVSFSL